MGAGRDGPLAWRGARAADFAIAEKYDHDRNCFSEGFSFVNNSYEEVIESCGLTGRSYIRRYNLKTGQTMKQQTVPRDIFGEGLVAFESRLYLLTYHRKQVLEFDGATWELRNRHPFPYGEGWGLTTDGCHLLATTGSSYIHRFQVEASGSWTLVSKVQVTWEGNPVNYLNELEYVTPKLWVNVWFKNTIWRVDPTTGACELRIMISDLYKWRGEATPNGIAYSRVLHPQWLLVTGKNWPTTFALQLSTADLCGRPLEHPPETCAKAPHSACWIGPLATPSQPPTQAGVASQAISATAAPLPTAPAHMMPQVKATVKAVKLPARHPIPNGLTVLATVLAAVLLISAVLLPMSIRRYQYRLLPQNGR